MLVENKLLRTADKNQSPLFSEQELTAKEILYKITVEILNNLHGNSLYSFFITKFNYKEIVADAN